MSLHVRAFPRLLALRTAAAACLGAVLLLLHGLGRTEAQSPPGSTPFGPTDFDTVYSDTVSVQYRVTRACLADVANCIGQPGHVSLCQPGQPITGLLCAAGTHRFCQAKGHGSGYGVELPQNSNEVDITCIRPGFVDAPLIPHASLQAQHPGCTTAMPSLACSVAADRYCRLQSGFSVGFGPLERNATHAVVSCVRTSAAVAFTPAPAEVEVLAPGCTLGAPEVSTACRQAMHSYCRSRGPFRGGFGPRELGSPVNLGCVRETLPWAPNAELPLPPALPVDILNSRGRFNPWYGLEWDPEPLHNRLQPARSFSFDGRLYTTRQLQSNTNPNDRFLQFNVQTPEVFTEPLSQRQPPGRDRSFEVEPWADNYDFEVAAGEFHRSQITGGAPNNTSGFDTASVAICDPHQGAQGVVASNQQQSVPSRVSNPFACTAAGGVDNAGPLDHDCYDVTIVGVFRRRENPFAPRDELWGTPVRVVVANPKQAVPHSTSDPTRARVSNVIIQGTPVMAPAPTVNQGLLEPSITGNGRLLVVQREGLIQYSVISPAEGAPCDVRHWGYFKDLHQMHNDPEMAGYGIAKYPLRDFEDHLVGSLAVPDREVRAAYPWIDRDGDNMMFMLGGQTLFYAEPGSNGGTVIRSRYEVVDHPVLGDVDWITTPFGLIPLRPTELGQLAYTTDGLPRVGLTLVGLWTQGKMFSPDNRNNAADFGVPGGPWHHRRLRLYRDVATEVGTSIRTDINSAENQLFFNPKLRPDAPREVVWALSTQYPGITLAQVNEHPDAAGGVTDEVEFDDVLDPRALVVSSMAAPIKATGLPWERGRFLDGFVWGSGYVAGAWHVEGRGLQKPAHIANSATSVSAAVVGVSPGLAANVQWNVPRFGYLLGGARAEPVAAGGFRGKGLWLDGIDDRLEYIVPPQPSATATDMTDAPWFYNLSIEPRSDNTLARERLLTTPDGTFLDLVGLRTIEYGRGATYASIQLPVALRPTPGRWSTVGIQSVPQGTGSEVRLYVDGFLFSTRSLTARLFRMQPGLLTVGAASGGFKGWVDDVKATSHRPGPEVACNHARGTVIGVSPGDPLDARAGFYPSSSHDEVSSILGNGHPHFARYACERPIESPADGWDLADHSHYKCLGQTRRPSIDPESAKCLREALVFPEGPLFVDLPRPDSRSNAFCTSCHVNSNASVTMRRDAALSAGLVPMPQEIRRQPMQHSPKFFGYVPAGLFGGLPASPFPTPREGIPLDPYTTPSSGGGVPPQP